MGDPRKQKKKYKKPGHPWEATRIKEELALKKEYGLSNKKELWRVDSKLRKWRKQARQIVSLQEKQRKEQESTLVLKLSGLGLLNKKAEIDDILALDARTVLDRRLQSQVYKRGLSNSIKQARQFILHGKIVVNGSVVTAPSYPLKQEDKIKIIKTFAPKLKVLKTISKKQKKPDKKEKDEKKQPKEKPKETPKEDAKEKVKNKSEKDSKEEADGKK